MCDDSNLLSTEGGADEGDPEAPAGLEGPSLALSPKHVSATPLQQLQLRQSSPDERHGARTTQGCGKGGREGACLDYSTRAVHA